MFRLQRAIPGFGGLDRICWSENQKIRNRPQRCEVLDWLMCRTILSQSDRVMRHHMDDAYTHQSRYPDCGPAVICKSQKCSAIGNEPAVEGDAVHRGSHCVLANAIVNVTAIQQAASYRLLRLAVGEVRMSEIS